jgi:glycerate kinase
MSLGLAGTYAVADSPRDVEAMVADPVQTLAARTARVARTWSPAR